MSKVLLLYTVWPGTGNRFPPSSTIHLIRDRIERDSTRLPMTWCCGALNEELYRTKYVPTNFIFAILILNQGTCPAEEISRWLPSLVPSQRTRGKVVTSGWTVWPLRYYYYFSERDDHNFIIYRDFAWSLFLPRLLLRNSKLYYILWWGALSLTQWLAWTDSIHIKFIVVN